jgi:hypothetical protein
MVTKNSVSEEVATFYNQVSLKKEILQTSREQIISMGD